MSVEDIAAEIEYRYVTVAKAIATSITEAEMQSGHQLPPREHLATAYNVSDKTVRRAVQLLQEHGVVVTLHGKGTFVDEHTADQLAAVLQHRHPQAEE